MWLSLFSGKLVAWHNDQHHLAKFRQGVRQGVILGGFALCLQLDMQKH